MRSLSFIALSLGIFVVLLAVRYIILEIETLAEPLKASSPEKLSKSSQTKALTWNIPEPPEQVLMNMFHTSVHYGLDSLHWVTQLPPGEHTIHLPDAYAVPATEDLVNGDARLNSTTATYTVALFHQLECLEILRDAYVEEERHRTNPLVDHCLNYVRQTILCRLDLRNEAQGAPTKAQNGFDTLCWNWEPVFEEAEKNYHIWTDAQRAILK